ncbi:MAG TPA: transglutaminase-like cysteine peptidase, partial [Syntrophales bacterium]|nr:transglutaminase-like cysteine peptidase [Syntrophales bacterium]
MAKTLNKFKWILLLSIILSGLVVAQPVFNGEDFRLNRDVLKKAELKYGRDARQRLLSWEDLIRKDKTSSDLQKLEKVNRFFNRMEFVDDIQLWGVQDYWATPIEFISRNAGDCEDFAIAKY